MERLHLRLYGGVQGVGFRYYAAREASRSGVSGYVRNRPDGSVEIEAAGEATALAGFRAAIVRGPPYARVQEVEEVPPGDGPLGPGFEIRR